MAALETSVVNAILKDVSPFGARLFRNVRGMFLTLDSLRKVIAGLLAPGASDLIGFKSVIVTQEMVGKKVAIFTAIEVKADSRPSKEQTHFIAFIKDSGGFAGIARSPEDARKILEIKS